MIKSLEQIRKDVDNCTQRKHGEGGSDMVWMTKSTLLEDLNVIEREVEERYVERPVDADGMTILPSDNMVDSNEIQFTVSSIELLVSGEWLVYGNGKLGSEYASRCHHYKPPTVEDLLRELVYRWGESTDTDAYIAEYAAKLQLKEAEY